MSASSAPSAPSAPAGPTAALLSESAGRRPPWTDYGVVAAVQSALIAGLVWITEQTPAPVDPRALLRPVIVMVGLTFAVLFLAATVRNVAVAIGRVSVRYYHDYRSDQPGERLERPARTFNNLMELPTLFYAVCAFMVATGLADQAQLALAWLFVATRVAHAVIYIGWNRVAFRFCAYAAGCITLGVMWTRFALQAWG